MDICLETVLFYYKVYRLNLVNLVW